MITLLSKKVAIFLIPDPDKTKSGLYIPYEAKERSDQGIVKYKADDVMDVEIGDYVMFSGYTGTNIQLEDEGNFTLMLEKDILCKIHPPNYQIPGLYYRDKKGWGELRERVEQVIINTKMSGDLASDITETIMGLVSTNNPYFSANYEQSVELLGKAFYESPFHRSNRIGTKYGDKKELRNTIT